MLPWPRRSSSCVLLLRLPLLQLLLLLQLLHLPIPTQCMRLSFLLADLSCPPPERARSISPQKSSPANTPSPRSNRRSVHLSEALRLESPGPAEHDEPEGKQEAMSYPLSSPTKENESPENDSKPTPRPPSRGSALSWQQRPKSRGGGGGGGGRPLSMLATQNAAQRSLTGSQEPSPASATEQSFSKDQIAQALGPRTPRGSARRPIGGPARLLTARTRSRTKTAWT